MFLNLLAHIVHHFFDPTPREWLQPNEEIADVRFAYTAAEL